MVFVRNCAFIPYCSGKQRKEIKVMDNNYSQRPRKRITRETARKRQLTALFVIAFLVLLFVILIAKGCSSDKSKKGGSSDKDTKPKTTSVTTTAPVDSSVTTTTVTPEATTAPLVNTSGFELDRYSVYLNVGQSEMPYVQKYPAGSTEADERWSSTDTTIATVDGIGNITALAPGECYVTLKSAVDPTQEVNIKVTVADNGNAGTGNGAGTVEGTTAAQ